MIKRIGLGLVVMSLTLFTPLSFVNAQDATDPDQPVSSEPTAATTTTDDFAIDDAKAADFQKRLEERLEARRNALKQKVTAAQQARIKLRCETAQTKITEIAKKASEAKLSRYEVYNKISARLTDVESKLAAKGADTTELKTSITELDKLVATFNTDLQSLRQAATDVTEMDCKGSPVGFKASLDELRAAREKLANDSEAIRTHIKDNVKPALQTLRNSLGSETGQQQGQDTTQEGAN